MNIIVEHSLKPSSKELPFLETERLLMVQQLIRVNCSIAELSIKHLAKLMKVTPAIIVDLKKSLRTKRYMEFEFVRDIYDMPSLVVRVAK